MRIVTICLVLSSAFCQLAYGFQRKPDSFSWEYYRPTNTGIQGDTCEALIVGPDGNPWIAGYDAAFEEGGIARFNYRANLWTNYSNVDYQVIGHPENTGTARVSDIACDASGNLWMGTGRGGLFLSPTVGAKSLRRFGDDNSQIHGGWNSGVEVAPDGSVWFSSFSTNWGSGGISHYQPTKNKWTNFEEYGGGSLAIQPRKKGYYVWTQLGSDVARFDSVSKVWKTFAKQDGTPAKLVGKNLTDSAGNVWMMRWTNSELNEYQLDRMRPDGTWFGLPLPPFANFVSDLRAKSPNLVLVADGAGGVWRFNGRTWQSLGSWEETTATYSIDQDTEGNVWVCGEAGAGRRDSRTGTWQRYRVTNTSQFDFFNEDLTVDRFGNVYAAANAGAGVGGLTKFDGKRWTGYNQLTYGLGEDWPFPTDNSHRVYVRPSNQDLLVNPTFFGLFQKTPSGWVDLKIGTDTVGDMIDDSEGRLWVTSPGFPGKVLLRENNSWKHVSDLGGNRLRKDPIKPGMVWVLADTSILSTDGETTTSWTIDDFPELSPISDQFKGMVVSSSGEVWIGANTINLPNQSSLIRLDPTTREYFIYRFENGWPFPGQYIMPVAATPDGRIWFQYDSDFGIDDSGLAYYDDETVVKFPATFEGRPQWGGLPHAAIVDVEQRSTRDGYQLWMSCASRGIAVLNVKRQPPRSR